jgi:hypothetical protein
MAGASTVNAITQMIMQRLSGSAVTTISQRLGVSESTANSAVQIAVPLILSAMARNTAQPDGAQDLHQAINNDHDGSIFDNLMGYLNDPSTGNGSGILGHVFGNQQSSIESNLAQVTGMDQGSAGSLLETVAPLVMGAVGQAQQQNGLDASGLSEMLNNQQQQAQTNSPDVMGMLGSMLDQNKDGSAVDDLQRLAANFFK